MDSEYKIKNLLRKYISQHCSPEELEELKKVMQLPHAKQLFDEVISEGFRGLEPEQDPDRPELEEKLQQFQLRLHQQSLEKPALENGMARSLKRRKYYYPMAAVWLVFVLGLGFYGLLKYKEKPALKELHMAMRTVANPLGQRSKIILPDSSAVYLGAGSKLRMPDHFAGNTREVELEGEAFFQVTKNPKKPFIIHTGSVQTKVLGTSFKIEAFRNMPLTVSVATGKVRVDDYAGHAAGRSLAVLMPGQKITYQHNFAVAGLVDAADVASWKDAKLVFHQRKLKEITRELERWYAVSIAYENGNKAEESISVTLQADVPLNSIMKVLSATGHFKYTIRGKNISIK